MVQKTRKPTSLTCFRVLGFAQWPAIRSFSGAQDGEEGGIYPKITKLLKNEGWKVGTRIVQRLRRELGLAVPKKRRRGPSTGLSTKATHRGQAWTWDFVYDTTMRGGKLRMLNVIDEYTPSLCPSIDLLYNIEQRINPSRLTKALAQFG